jgi:DNA polymerase I
MNVGGKLGIKVKLDTGEWRIIEPSIRPYFFIRSKDYGLAQKILKNVDVIKGDYVTTRGEPCLKIEVDFPNEVRNLREKLKAKGIPTFEADIAFVRRWMIDTGLRVSRKPKTLYWDMEADSRRGIWIPEEGKPPEQRILSIAAVDNSGKEYFICLDDEVEIINQFKKLMEEYDLLVGYNNLRWDNPFLEARAKVLGVPLNMKITNWQDMMLLYNKSWGGGYVSLKLDKVAEKELGERKKLDLYKYKGAEGIWKMFENDREALKEYNLWDAMLLKMLNDKLGCLDVAIEMAYISHCFYQDALFNSRIVDGLLLRKSLMRSPRIVYQNKYGMAYKFGTYVRGEEKKHVEPYTGGLVIDPKPGLFRDVINFDFSSLYPRTIMTFNIGVETINENGEILSGNPNARFVKKPRSIIAEFLEELNDLRVYYRELLSRTPSNDPKYKIYNIKQYELKILLNATAGVIGAYGFRFYDRDVAESITLTGRELLKMLTEILEELNFEILYLDTDGCFCRKEGFDIYKFKEKEKSLLWLVNNELRQRAIKRFNIPPEYYCEEVKVDDVYSKIFFSGVKKRYIGEIYDFSANVSILDTWRNRDKVLEGIPLKRNIVGYDIIRLDVPNIVKKVQSKVFDIIFKSESREEIRRKIQEMLKVIHSFLFSGQLDEDLIIEKGTRRKLDKYKAEDIHVKIAKELAKRGMFRPGDSIEYVIIDEGKEGFTGAPIIEGEPFPKISPKGYRYYWDRILNVVERVLGEKIDPFMESLENWI